MARENRLSARPRDGARAAAAAHARARDRPRSAASSGAGGAGRRASTAARSASRARASRRRAARRRRASAGSSAPRVVGRAVRRPARRRRRAAAGRPRTTGAASGSSSLSWSIGVQIPSGHTAETWIAREPGAAQVRERAERERHRAVLGRGVERLARRRAEPGERDDVDQVPAPGGPHQLERGQRAVDRPERVDLEQRPPQLGVVLPDVAGDQHAGVVDPDVERAGALGRRGGRPPSRPPRRARRAPMPQADAADRRGRRLGGARRRRR